MSISSAKVFVEIMSSDEEGDEIQFVPYVKPPPPVIDLLISSSDNDNEANNDQQSSSPRKKKKAKRKSQSKDERPDLDLVDPNENVAQTCAIATPTPNSTMTMSSSSAGSNVDYQAKEAALKAAFAGVGRNKRRASLDTVDDDELFAFPDFSGASSDNAIVQGSEASNKPPEALPSIRLASSIFESVPEPAEAELASSTATVVESEPIPPTPAAKRGRKSQGSLGQPGAGEVPGPRKRVSKKQFAKQRTNEEIFHFLSTIGFYKPGEAPPELPPEKRARKGKVVASAPVELVCPLPLVPEELALSEELDAVPVAVPIRRNVTTSTPGRTPTPSPTKSKAPQTEVSNNSAQNEIYEEPIAILCSDSQPPEDLDGLMNTESLLGISRALGPAEPLPLAPRKVTMTMTPNENLTVKLKVTKPRRKKTPPPAAPPLITTGVWITPTPRKRPPPEAKRPAAKKKKCSDPAPAPAPMATATATLNRTVTKQQLAAAENSVETNDIVQLPTPTPLFNINFNSEPMPMTSLKPYLPVGWSREMANYYDSEPNHNFYKSKVLATMSDDKSLWKHNEARAARGRPRVNRNLRCVNCKQTGHLARSCNEKKRQIVCHRCGQIGHDENSTSKFYKKCHNAVCLICGRRYNETKYGCNGFGCKYNNRRPLKCATCDGPHSSAHCPDNWRRYCNTTSLTEVEFEEGTFAAFGDKPEYRLHKDSFCANCGGKGHSFYHCRIPSNESHHNKFPKQNPRIFNELLPPPVAPKLPVVIELPKEPEPEVISLVEPETQVQTEPIPASNEPNSATSSPIKFDSQVTTVPETPEPSPQKSLEKNLEDADEGLENDEAPFRFNFQTQLIGSLQNSPTKKPKSSSKPWSLPPLDQVPAFASTSKGIVSNPYYTPSSNAKPNAKPNAAATATITSGDLEAELEYERRPVAAVETVAEANNQNEGTMPTIRIQNVKQSVQKAKNVEEAAPPTTKSTTMGKCEDYPDCSNTPKPPAHCYNMSIVPEHHALLLEAWLADSSIIDNITSEHSVQISLLRRQRSIHILGPFSALLPAQISILSAISKIQTEPEPSKSILSLAPPKAPEPDLIILDDDEGGATPDKKSVLTVALLESEWALISAQSFQTNGLLSQLSAAFGVNIHVCKDSLTASIEDGSEGNRKLAQKNIVFWLECHAAKVDYVMQYSMDAPALSALPPPPSSAQSVDWSKKKRRPPAPSSRPQSRKFNKRQRSEEEAGPGPGPRSPAKRRRNRQARWSEQASQVPTSGEGLYLDFGSQIPAPGYVFYDQREYIANQRAQYGSVRNWDRGPNSQGWYSTRPRRRRKAPAPATTSSNNGNTNTNVANNNNNNNNSNSNGATNVSNN